MRSTLPTDVPPYFWTIRAIVYAAGVEGSLAPGSRDAAEGERRVGAAEAERVGERAADRHRTGGQRHEIEVALRILVEQVRRGRRDLVAQRKRGEHGLDATRGPEQVAGHRLGRADGQLRRARPERAIDGDALGDVAERRRRAVRVDVIDLVDVHPGVAQRVQHAPRRALPVL